MKAVQSDQKTQQWACKVMASVFWDARGILFIDCLEKGETVNNDYYMALLDRLSTEIKKKRLHMQKNSAVPPRQCTMPQVHVDDGQI